MGSLGHFGHYLYQLKPKQNMALLSLYNYIRQECYLESQLSPQFLSSFFQRALCFEHWQKNAVELSVEVKKCLADYLKHDFSKSEWASLKFPDEMELLKINSEKDRCEIILKFIEMQKLSSEVKIFSDHNESTHAIVASFKGLIIVQSFDNIFYINKGVLVPLNPGRCLAYDSSLELSKNFSHKIKINSHVFCKFKVDEKISGDYIRGYSLQNYKHFEAYRVEQEQELFHSIKKIERFFIDRNTDPLYLDLVKILEDSIQFLKQKRPGAIELGRKAYARGEDALHNVFVDDKLIAFLLKEISCRIPSDSISSSRNQEWLQEEPPMI